MYYLSVKDFYRTQPHLGFNRLYDELKAGKIKSFRTSERGRYLIPESEIVAYPKRLLREIQ